MNRPLQATVGRGTEPAGEETEKSGAGGLLSPATAAKSRQFDRHDEDRT